jgi:hypothetical protein
MPTGAYNLNAWSDNLNDAPVIPNGLQVTTYNQALTTLTIANAANNNYNNQVGVIGGSNNRVYFAVGYGGSAASYTGLVTINLITGATTSATTLSNQSLGNNEVACITGQPQYGNGQNTGLVVSSWNQNATPTETRNNSVYLANWVNYGSTGTTYAGGNTTLGIFTSAYEKGRSGAISAPMDSQVSTGARWVGVACSAAGSNQVKTYTYSASAAFTLALNHTNTNDWNIQNGVRITTFYPQTTATNNVVYVGYSSTNNLYIGSIYCLGTATPTQSAVDMNIAYTTKNAMIKNIWDNNDDIRISAVLHSDQYIRFVKCSQFGSSFDPTQSRDFLISDMPNSWYRLCSTGINGLGALVYYVDTEGSFYIKFFSINTSIDTITWGNPIQLNVNSVYDMVMMNAEVKYLSCGFCVGIFANNGSNNNQFFASVLWPVNRPMTNVGYQNSYAQSSLSTFDTTYSKFGGSSLYISGNQALQPLPAANNSQPVNSYNIGTGNFTVEFWIRMPSSTTLTAGQFAGLWNFNSTNYFGIAYSTLGGYQWRYNFNSITTDFGTVTFDSWVHIALVRTSNFLYRYINGVQSPGLGFNINLNSANYSSNLGGVTGGQSLVRWYNEFRFSNIARYTSSFTPAIAPFRNDVNTLCLLHLNTGTNVTTFNRNAIIDDWGPNYSG